MPPTTKSKPRRKSGGGKNAQWATRRSQGLQLLHARSLSKLPRLVHAFTTRSGGSSLLAERSPKSSDHRNSGETVLNLGLTEWDTRDNVLANRAKLLSALGAREMQLLTLKQIHSDIIHVLDSVPAEILQGDAAITHTPGLLLAAQTADCIPILLADPRQRAVAAIHSGWRGTLRRIAAKTIGRMQMVFGTRPADVIAAIGPGIGRCCYEVGVEVVKEFAAQFPQAADWFTGPYEQLSTGEEPNPFLWLSMSPPGHEPPPPTAQLDLAAANRAILVEAGVSPRNITVSNLCTSCRTDLLFSHRREAGRTGRQLAVIGLL
jgi:YfiH family protein